MLSHTTIGPRKPGILDKLVAAKLVLGSMTTGESSMLYVFCVSRYFCLAFLQVNNYQKEVKPERIAEVCRNCREVIKAEVARRVAPATWVT